MTQSVKGFIASMNFSGYVKEQLDTIALSEVHTKAADQLVTLYKNIQEKIKNRTLVPKATKSAKLQARENAALNLQLKRLCSAAVSLRAIAKRVEKQRFSTLASNDNNMSNVA